MSENQSVASVCFSDDPDDHMRFMRNLFDFYIEVDGDAGETVVSMEADSGHLTIEVSKGFHCLSIPIEDVKKVLKKEDSK